MVQGGDDEGDIFAHIGFNKPFGFRQLRLAVGQVGGNDPIDETVAIGFFKGINTVGEEGKGAAREDAVGLALFQLFRQVDDAFAAGQHIVRDEDVFAFHAVTQVFMSDNGVAAVHDAGVITTLVEQTHIQPQNRGIEDVAVDGAFIRGDDHHVFLIDPQGLVPLEQGLEDLITGHDALKTGGGDGVLNPGIMRVKGDDVADTHVLQFLKGHGTVQTLTG